MNTPKNMIRMIRHFWRTRLSPYQRTARWPRLIGDPVLRATTQPVNTDYIQTSDFSQLTEEMVNTMRDREVVGIAAPQIGESLKVIAMEFPEEYLRVTPHKLGIIEEEEVEAMEMSVFPLKIFVNPMIVVTDPTITELPEGSVSVPGYKGIVRRYNRVELQAMDENGEEVKWQVCGWPARIIQQQVDHLNGTLYTDRMKPETFENFECNYHLNMPEYDVDPIDPITSQLISLILNSE